MLITRRFARYLTVALIALLFIGTLMPGTWKESATAPFHSPVDLAVLAHIALFAAICFLVPIARFWKVNLWHLPVLGLGLALLTEGLQFFAIDRHPNMAGVYQDMLGVFMGWGLQGALASPMAAALRARLSLSAEWLNARNGGLSTVRKD